MSQSTLKTHAHDRHTHTRAHTHTQTPSQGGNESLNDAALQFKLSKKVAELTLVVHMLFTRNHEREVSTNVGHLGGKQTVKSLGCEIQSVTHCHYGVYIVTVGFHQKTTILKSFLQLKPSVQIL